MGTPSRWHYRNGSREAAKECSPRRKPWESVERLNQPRRGERNELNHPQCEPNQEIFAQTNIIDVISVTYKFSPFHQTVPTWAVCSPRDPGPAHRPATVNPDGKGPG